MWSCYIMKATHNVWSCELIMWSTILYHEGYPWSVIMWVDPVISRMHHLISWSEIIWVHHVIIISWRLPMNVWSCELIHVIMLYHEGYPWMWSCELILWSVMHHVIMLSWSWSCNHSSASCDHVISWRLPMNVWSFEWIMWSCYIMKATHECVIMWVDHVIIWVHHVIMLYHEGYPWMCDHVSRSRILIKPRRPEQWGTWRRCHSFPECIPSWDSMWRMWSEYHEVVASEDCNHR